MEFEVAAVGDNTIDRFSGARDFSLVGGNALNVAVQFARLGRKAAYFGAIGDDDDGRLVLASLAANGVVADGVCVLDKTTSYTLVERNQNGDRRFLHEEFGATEHFRVAQEALASLLPARHVHIGWLNDGGALRQALAGRGGTVSQDISVNADPKNLGVSGLDIVFASHSGSEGEIVEFARHLLSNGAKKVVVTRGENGSFATDGDEFRFLEACAIEPVDTTGAGDSFIAGFLDAWLKCESTIFCLESGRKLASETCMHLGGFPQDSASPH